MEDYIKEIFIALFAGTNILQFIFFKASKRKAEADADSAVLDNKQKALDIRTGAMSSLQQQCDTMMDRMKNINNELQDALVEVAKLKALSVSLTEERDHYKLKYERAIKELNSMRGNHYVSSSKQYNHGEV